MDFEPISQESSQRRASVELDLRIGEGGLELAKGRTDKWALITFPFPFSITSQQENFNCVTIGLTNTFDASSCDINLRWICEKLAK